MDIYEPLLKFPDAMKEINSYPDVESIKCYNEQQHSKWLKNALYTISALNWLIKQYPNKKLYTYNRNVVLNICNSYQMRHNFISKSVNTELFPDKEQYIRNIRKISDGYNAKQKILQFLKVIENKDFWPTLLSDINSIAVKPNTHEDTFLTKLHNLIDISIDNTITDKSSIPEANNQYSKYRGLVNSLCQHKDNITIESICYYFCNNETSFLSNDRLETLLRYIIKLYKHHFKEEIREFRRLAYNKKNRERNAINYTPTRERNKHENTIAIYRLKKQGLTQKQVAKELGLSRSTIQRHWNLPNIK